MNRKQLARFGLALRFARIRSGIGQETIAEQVGVSQPTVSRWERGRCLPDVTQLSSLLALTGADRQVAELAQAVVNNGEVTEHLIDARLDALLGYYMVEPRDPYDKVVPLYADIAAGLGEFQPALEHPRGSIQIPAEVYRRDPTAYALRVVGDSMEPLICAGDVLVISPATAIADGSIVAACVEPEGDVVKLYRELPDQRIALTSLNPEFPDIMLEQGNGRAARIWGRVIMQQREL